MASPSFKVFVVEDNEWYNKLLVHNLSLNPDLEVKSFTQGKDLLQSLSENPQVITLDYRLPDMNGEQLLEKIKQFNDQIEVIIISEQEEIETAVELLKKGAYDYLTKNKDIQNRLLNSISKIKKNHKLKDEISSLKKEVQGKYNFEQSIIGSSEAIKKIFHLIHKACETNITVSVHGETGTGKEVVAKAIHYNSKRKNKPFVAVNMAAIPSELIESELFGHEKGAFTGATARRIGKFEEADQGTLFLDEIGEIDLNIQVKLLRVLQEREITRIGSNASCKIDCRIIVATHKDLRQEVKNGNFREDLYYRLFGLPIELPPLRDRDNDVIILAKHFMNLFCKENDLNPKKLAEEAKSKLKAYHFPGNVRELKSLIELAIVLSDTDEIAANDITLNSMDEINDLMLQEQTLREYNQRIVQLYMKKYSNDTKQVAKQLDIGQTTVYRLLKESKDETE
tara:strand:+ start:9108 stop:10466 length:1359 start_codon:yes stop_codon:yes gene_type:complete